MNLSVDHVLNSPLSTNATLHPSLLQPLRFDIWIAGTNRWFAAVCWFQAVVAIAGHTLLLTAYARDATLRTAFGCYVINILLGDLVIILFVVLMALETTVGSQAIGWLCPLTDPSYMIGASVGVSTQVSLVLSRTWAMFAPYHFRRWHTKTAVFRLCTSIWVFTLLLVVPYLVLTFSLYRQLGADGCAGVSAFLQPTYYKVISFTLTTPALSVFVLFPVLQRKDKDLKLAQRELLARNLKLNQVANVTQSRTDSPSDTAITATQSTVKSGRKFQDKSVNFWILRWIFVAAILFWTPMALHRIFLDVTHVSTDPSRSRVADFWLIMWATVHVCLEPLMFTLTIRPLRNRIRQILSSKILPSER